MATATDSLADTISTVENCAINNSQEPCLLAGCDRQARANSKGMISEESIMRMKQMLPVSVANLFFFSHAQFCNMYADTSEVMHAELLSRNSSSIEQKIDNLNREYSICLKMSDTGHYYMILTVHTF